ncbi:uncharacterized protein PFL1_02708 [Pseudozyma flocculosa PF-1]|uniref:ubiquitinyl hydrolase 1 n=1 Tax=Pseudozyma flocculosa PF-1 TaxID=1277687 RepID=A0A061HAJ9_9BASI|nr:uncharacterized protein PFL1_02708 [Pseudozyma flocculosa PF-1]EPQ29489.1 hypothetical protein PFL1_02708 [Pseudozyma flocculosa PF-1]
MVYPRNPYSTPNVSFFGGSGSGSKANGAALRFDPAPHPGLVNLGNTCFLNAVLQAMGGTRQFKLLLQGPSEQLQDHFGHLVDLTDEADFEWIKRSQSPALRVRDEEHGKGPQSQPVLPRPASAQKAGYGDGASTLRPKRDHPADPAQAEPQPSGIDGGEQAQPLHEPTVIDLPLNTALRHTLEKIWGSSNSLRGPSINPKRLLTLLGAKYDQYLEYGQQDGHELMRHLLDACRMEEMDLIKKMQPPKDKKTKKRAQPSQQKHAQSAAQEVGDARVDTEVAGAMDLQMGDVDRGEAIAAPMSVNEADQAAVVVVDEARSEEAGDAAAAAAAVVAEETLLPFLDMLFCGKLASMIVCESCKKVSHTYEDFFDLSLSIRSETDVRVKKRDRIRNMADRWRRATQGKPVEKSKLHDATAASAATPVATPVFSETEASDAEGKKPHKKRGSFLSPADEGKTRFSLRTRSITRRPTSAKRAEKLGATSGSEMEPDFPDMASLSLAPTPRHMAADSAPPSAGEDDGDARTNTRLPRMLAPHPNGGESSREPSPSAPIGGRALPAAANGNGISAGNVAPTLSSHQADYIARILTEDAAPAAAAANGLPRRPATASGASGAFSDVVAQVSSAHGRHFHALHRGMSTRGPRKSALSEFETDPGSPSAKRRKQIQEEQNSTGLIAALRQFTSVEVLDGENSFACKNCWRLQNPPSAKERERYRRRKERRGLRYGSDDESEPSSSEGGSESDREGAVARATAKEQARHVSAAAGKSDDGPLNGSATLADGAAPSDMAPRRFNASIPTITTHAGTPPATEATEGKQLGLQNEAMAKLSAPHRDEHGHRPPDSPLMASSHGSDSNLSASASGYDTGTETDRSGVATSLDSETGLDESDADADETRPAAPSSKPKGPKRSTQSLPRRALKRYLIASAPPVLVFHLKRFQATGRGFVSGLAGFKKIDDQVTFPEYLDITPWLAPPREEYDRKGRLKGTSDPLVLRRRAEEEARRAGMDIKDVQVQVDSPEAARRRGRHRHGRQHHGHGDAGEGDRVAGKRHSMWSWTARERSRSRGPPGEGASAAGAGAYIEEAEEVQEGPRVKQGDREILPTVVSRPKTQYRLYAVVVHQGSLSAGHYTAYVLSDKIRLSNEEKANLLTTTVTRSAPASRVNTPAPANEAHRERRRSTQLAETPALQPLAEAEAKAEAPAGPAIEGDGAAASLAGPTTMSTGDSSAALSSSGSSAHSSAGSDGAARPPPPLVQPKPQAATGSIQSAPEGPPLVTINGNGNGTANGAPNSSAESLKPARSPNPAAAAASTAGSSSNGAARAEPRPDRSEIDDGRRWVYTSDTVVRAASIDEVLKAKAYMLFYERV